MNRRHMGSSGLPSDVAASIREQAAIETRSSGVRMARKPAPTEWVRAGPCDALKAARRTARLCVPLDTGERSA